MEGVLLEVTTQAAKWGIREIGIFLIDNWGWFTSTLAAPAYIYIRKCVKWIKAMNIVKEQLPQINSKLDTLIAEFRTNGGSSLKDQINNIDRRTALTQQWVWSGKESSPDGEFTADPKGHWNRINRTFLNMIGAREEQIKGLGWIGYLSDGDSEDVREKYLLAIEENRGVSFRCHFKRDGSYDGFWNVIFTLSPLKSADDVLLGFTGTIKKL